MGEKRVRTIEEIVFERHGITLPKGAEYGVEAVTEDGVILCDAAGDRFLIDLTTFENGFMAVE